MEHIVFTEKEFQAIKTYIDTIPTQWGRPLANFLDKLLEDRLEKLKEGDTKIKEESPLSTDGTGKD